MGGELVQIGPWRGGLNLAKDQSLLRDDELDICVNMFIGDDGELITRSGIRREGVNIENLAFFGYSLVQGTTRIYAADEGTKKVYWIALGPTPENHFISNIVDASSTAAGHACAMVQYVDPGNSGVAVVYIVPKTGGTGVKHTPVINSYALISGMPKGSEAIMFKDRMFITGNQSEVHGPNNYRVYYSATGNAESWPVNNFFDVSPGDFDFVAALAVIHDTLYIFKQRSIWALSFETDPFNGTLRKINEQYGATGPFSVAVSQNIVYFIGDRSIYRLQNNFIDDIGDKLSLKDHHNPFGAFNLDSIVVHDQSLTAAIRTNLLGTRIYRYFNCNLNNGAWTEYDFREHLNRLLYVPISENGRVYSGTWIGNRANTWYSWYPGHDYTPSFCSDDDYLGKTWSLFQRFVTREFNYPPMHTFKRIYWWGVNLLVRGDSDDISANIGLTIDGFEAADTDFAEQQVAQGQRRHIRGFISNRFKALQYRFSVNSVQGLRTAIIIYDAVASISSKGRMSKRVT